MLNICVLASGSSGNATALWNDGGGILIDFGCSRKYIEAVLSSIGCAPGNIKGIVVTHCHSDHVAPGATLFARHHNVPFYLHEATYRSLCRGNKCGRFGMLDWNLIHYHSCHPFSVGAFAITPFATYHTTDGASFGFTVICPHHDGPFRVGYITDTGRIDDVMVAALADCRVLVIEANHDPDLVASSFRHPGNKEWVVSDYGHMNNLDAAETIIRVRRRSSGEHPLKYVFLAHISRDHNTVEHALNQVRSALDKAGMEDIRLIPTYHRRKSAVLKVN